MSNNQSKQCFKCKITLSYCNFYKNKKAKDSHSNVCKKCYKEYRTEKYKTKSDVIKKIYLGQVQSSRKRNHNPPSYTKEQHLQWLINDWVFNLLYENWVNCGYINLMKPSIDRINDDKGYSFDNIQIMTWGENKAKGYISNLHLKITRKKVLQLNIGGHIIKEFDSMVDVRRQGGFSKTRVIECCKKNLNLKQGEYKTMRGFVWKYK